MQAGAIMPVCKAKGTQAGCTCQASVGPESFGVPVRGPDAFLPFSHAVSAVGGML